ncbi:hypothetical protein KKP04_13635 [Rhodomicrobium sp. Az07]|uniref:hypothetical protein n=1 Tax=Rhodomicrobium sp. Az07 TaxID=2839034 RepID=UPI001BE57D8A|nr:hypothetical protein [Rhodomicrobium sp. Az07]MBT3071905.1 hypothetical protein [Rhodomicrobium sp. Az07]
MVATRSMLARVRRLERPRRSTLADYILSPEYEAEVKAGIEAGTLDRIDMPGVLAAMQKLVLEYGSASCRTTISR